MCQSLQHPLIVAAYYNYIGMDKGRWPLFSVMPTGGLIDLDSDIAKTVACTGGKNRERHDGMSNLLGIRSYPILRLSPPPVKLGLLFVPYRAKIKVPVRVVTPP